MMDSGDTGVIERLSSPAPCNVMVVDDDDLIRAHVTTVLTQAGYQVHSASTGEQALLMLGSRPCQIVVTDWQMPGMDGPSLCRALRLRDSDSYTYVLMLAVHDAEADILASLGAGADDYLVKGASAEQLLARVDVGRRIALLEHSLRVSGAENRQLSVTDPLTGAQNRRFLMKYLPRELTRSRRYNRPIAVLSCDIDEFTRITECHGQKAGDEVLQAFVSHSMRCTRESIDWIARVAGEEFVIVLPETTLDRASIVAEKVRRALADRAVPTSSGPLSATVSIGAAALESPDELAGKSVVELLCAADSCRQVSKKLGKNRFTNVAP